jgi:twitching motility protein PilI
METEHFKTGIKTNSDWLPPTQALTRYRPPETGLDVAAPAAREHAVIGFRIGTVGFLTAAGTFCEVLEHMQVNPLPNVQTWFSGLLNLRGNLVPVIDLRALLGEEASLGNEKRHLFAVGRGEKTVALWIDGLPEMLSGFSQPLARIPPLSPVLQRYVSGGYLHFGRLWLNVQFDELFKALGSQHAN